MKDSPLARLLAVLDRDGEEARAIGGAVRDSLLGMTPGEIDVATTATPPEVIRRVQAAGYKAVPTGIDHGTVTVVVAGHPMEVTTLREDIETFGRKANVRFGRDWKADAERRDFTINALSVSADGTVHDYVGGLADLAAQRVRFIGDPATRIAEDFLRILRFFRFHARYGEGPPDAAGLHAAIVARDGLDLLSRERIRMELMKLLSAPRAVPTLAVMAEAGILGKVLGGVPLLVSMSNMAKLEAALGLEPDPVRRLGALSVFVAEDAERLRQRLRLFNTEHERLAAMADAWWRVAPSAAAQGGRALLYRLGPAQFTDRVLLAWSRSPDGAADSAWRELATLPQRWTAPAFPLKAADLLKRGVPKGPRLGAALRAAETAWMAQDFPLDAEALREIAEQVVKAP
ncbi:MAG TPA: CCA tRNA nucleotidyltransferase [Xanthobacteraceae bacterium]|nr:CCA tRNA nucleotidyltransferase [Xanthobacteraceae bacterium]